MKRAQRSFGVASWVGLLLVVMATGCRPREAPAPPVRALEGVELSACDGVDAKGTCVLPSDGTLRAFVPGGGDVAFEALGANGAPLPAPDATALLVRREDVDGGVLVTLHVASESRALRVTQTRPEGFARATRPLAAPWDLPPVLREASRLRAEGKHDEAAARLEAHRATLETPMRPFAAAMLGRIRVLTGRADEATALLAESSRAHEAEGRRVHAARDESVRVFALLSRHRIAEARVAMEREQELARGNAEAEALAAHDAGQFASTVGDLRTAFAELTKAEARAARLGLTHLRDVATGARASLLVTLGRPDEARERLRAQLARPGSPLGACDRAAVLVDIGWSVMAEARAAEGPLDEGRAREGETATQEAVALFRGACRDDPQAANALTNLAHAALLRGAVDAARARVSEARALHVSPSLEIEWLALEGDARLATKDARGALAAFETLAERARDMDLPDEEWRAADGRAAALVALGRADDAIGAAAVAERALDHVLRLVPFGEGRGTFAGARARSTRRLVALHLARGDAASALAAVRGASARLALDARWAERLAGLDPRTRADVEGALTAYRTERDALAADAEQDVDRAASELALARARRARRRDDARRAFEAVLGRIEATPSSAAARAIPSEPGDVLVAYADVTGGSVALVAAQGRVRAVALGPVDPAAGPEALATKLLDPLAGDLATARHLRVLSAPSLRNVDVHALPFRGAPLVARATVSYPRDVAREPGRAPEAGAGGRPRALVVLDPTGTLPAARAEGRAVEQALRADGRRDVEVLEGRAATAARVRGALATADVLHYAGHAVFRGRDGWESALRMADGEGLDVTDVLAAPRVPRGVVLSACEAAKADAAGDVLGVAQAFLAAGASWVIAATRPVGDGLAAALAQKLYAEPMDDPAEALRRAQLRVLADDPAADAAAFRLLTP